MQHFWSLIEALLGGSGHIESENWNAERYTIILGDSSPAAVPDETFAQLGEDRRHEFLRAMVKVKPVLSEHINPDGTII